MAVIPYNGYWVALRVKQRFENACSAALRSKGYDEYLPTYQARSCTNEPRPLFPGYLFCKLDPHAAGKIVTTPGVLNIVRFGYEFARVEQAELDAIRALLASGLPLHAHPYARQGESVEVTSGPLCGTHGYLIRVKNSKLLVVSITILQRAVSVELTMDSVIFPRNSAAGVSLITRRAYNNPA